MSEQKVYVRKLAKEYGLSCLENYILYLLAQENKNWQQVFIDSYLSFDNVLEKIGEGQTYSYFKGVPRVHETGKKMGLLNIQYYHSSAFPYDLVKNKYFAMQVSEKFIKEEFNKVLWRSDHYMLLKYIGQDEFTYLNDIPECTGCISLRKVHEIYKQNILIIEVEKEKEVDKKELAIRYLKKIEKDVEKRRVWRLTFENLRDAIGIMKVLVRRVEAFMNMLNIPICTVDYYEYLSNCYVKAEYMRLKAICDEEQITEIINKIYERDKAFKLYVCQRLSAFLDHESYEI